MVLGVLAGIGGAAGLIGGITQGNEARNNALEIRAFKARRFEDAKYAGLEKWRQFSRDTRVKQLQNRDLLTRQIQDLTETTLLRKGRIAASAGGSGVAGTSVDEETTREEVREQRALGDIRLRRDFTDVATEFELESGRSEIRNRILAAQPTPTSVPSEGSVLFGGITGGLSGAASLVSIGSNLGFE